MSGNSPQKCQGSANLTPLESPDHNLIKLLIYGLDHVVFPRARIQRRISREHAMAKMIEINGKKYKLGPLGLSRAKQKKTGTRLFVPELGTVYVQVYEDTPESIALNQIKLKAKQKQIAKNRALAGVDGKEPEAKIDRSDVIIALLMKSNERLEKRLEELENVITAPPPSGPNPPAPSGPNGVTSMAAPSAPH